MRGYDGQGGNVARPELAITELRLGAGDVGDVPVAQVLPRGYDGQGGKVVRPELAVPELPGAMAAQPAFVCMGGVMDHDHRREADDVAGDSHAEHHADGERLRVEDVHQDACGQRRDRLSRA